MDKDTLEKLEIIFEIKERLARMQYDLEQKLGVRDIEDIKRLAKINRILAIKVCRELYHPYGCTLIDATEIVEDLC